MCTPRYMSQPVLHDMSQPSILSFNDNALNIIYLCNICLKWNYQTKTYTRKIKNKNSKWNYQTKTYPKKIKNINSKWNYQTKTYPRK